jgi:hypothetical protein
MSFSATLLRRRSILVAVAAAGISLTVPAGAASLGPLEPYLLIGSDPPWTGTLEGNGYRLTNTANDTDIVYFVAALPGGLAQEIAVTVGVQPQAGAAYSGAGLIFDFDHQTRNYLALVVTAANELAIYQRNAQGVGELARLPLAGTSSAGTLRLVLRATDKGVAFEANGTHQGSVDGVGLSGQAGIVAIDGGSYTFADYQVR